MRIGLDVNMDTNIAEGYGILEFKKRELYVKGQFNPKCDVRFIRHYPEYIKDEMVGNYTSRVGIPLMVDTSISAQDAYEQYQRHASSIDSFCGTEPRTVPSDEYELLNLASDIDQYCGLC